MDLLVISRQARGVTILDITGRIVLGEETAYLRNFLSDLLNQGHTKILLNLSGVTHIDTSGLGFLIGALARVRQEKGELKLLNLPSKIEDLMQITKIYTVFEILHDEATAVSSFSQASAATTR